PVPAVREGDGGGVGAGLVVGREAPLTAAREGIGCVPRGDVLQSDELDVRSRHQPQLPSTSRRILPVLEPLSSACFAAAGSKYGSPRAYASTTSFQPRTSS